MQVNSRSRRRKLMAVSSGAAIGYNCFELGPLSQIAMSRTLRFMNRSLSGA